MSKDYSPAVATALAGVSNYGRNVILRSLTQTPDPDKPWRDDATGSSPAPDVTVKALGIGPSKMLSEDFLQDVQDVLIVAGNVDYSHFHEVVDGSKVWRIIRSQVLKPGDTIILTYLGIAR